MNAPFSGDSVHSMFFGVVFGEVIPENIGEVCEIVEWYAFVEMDFRCG